MSVAKSGDRFLATLWHELRTPTTAILGWAELLGQTPVADPKLTHGIDIIKRNAQLQAQLIDHLIDYCETSTEDFKLDVKKIAILPTLQAAIETMMPLALAKDINMALHLDHESSFIMGDTFRLQQVFMNLISNAIRFTPSGGDIRIVLTKDGTSVEIKVSDTGRGISDECLQDIFNGCNQLANRAAPEPGGLGIGLNISLRLIERHGGQIAAFSHGKGHGATFTVHLPLADVSVSDML